MKFGILEESPGCRIFFMEKSFGDYLTASGYLDGITGVYQTPKGYYVKDEDVEEFDKGFPPKEKLKLPGQIF